MEKDDAASAKTSIDFSYRVTDTKSERQSPQSKVLSPVESAKTSIDFTESYQVTDTKSERQSPFRKALSPVDVNVGQRALVTCSEPFEPQTPVTSSKSCTNKLHNFATPLDKFNECSSNLKASRNNLETLHFHCQHFSTVEVELMCSNWSADPIY